MELVKYNNKPDTKGEIPFKFAKRRKGDAAESFCSPKKALKELNWKSKYDLKQAVMDIKKIL